MPTFVQRNAPRLPRLSTPLVRRLGNAMLAKLGRADAELSVVLTSDEQIQELNREHRAKDKPTDVLSFYFDAAFGDTPFAAPRLLGDVVISLETAARQADSRKRSLAAEVRWLLAHGVLHLLGHDHAEPEEKRVMVALTRQLVRAAPLPDELSLPVRATTKKVRATTKKVRAATPSARASVARDAPIQKTASVRSASRGSGEARARAQRPTRSASTTVNGVAHTDSAQQSAKKTQPRAQTGRSTRDRKR